MICGNADRIRYYFMAILQPGGLLSFTIGRTVYPFIHRVTRMAHYQSLRAVMIRELTSPVGRQTLNPFDSIGCSL